MYLQAENHLYMLKQFLKKGMILKVQNKGHFSTLLLSSFSCLGHWEETQ